MSDEELRAIAGRKKKDSGDTVAVPATPDDILNEAFPQQRDVITNPSRWKVVCCARRAGKTDAAALFLLRTAMLYPGTDSAFISLVKDSVRRVMWKKIKKWNKKLRLGGDPKEQQMTLTFPNESVIQLLGVDANDQVGETLLGQFFKLVILDECGSFRTDLKKLVTDIIEPTLSDLRGTLVLLGAPRPQALNGYFHRASTNNDEDRQWATWHWSRFDNPFMREQTIEEAANMDHESPLFKRNFLGLWVRDDSDLCYITVPTKESPAEDANTVTLLGVDMGYLDATAYVVARIRRGVLTIIHAEKKTKCTNNDVLARIKELQRQYQPLRTIIDGNKQTVETWRIVDRVHAELPSKVSTEGERLKFERIEAFNSAVRAEQIVIGEGCPVEPLVNEWLTLMWKDETHREENEKKDNHCADAALYCYEAGVDYLAVQEPELPDERMEAERDMDIGRMLELQAERQRESGYVRYA